MKYQRLGNTNLIVSQIGFGGIPIQRVTQDEVNIIVRELLANKINFIDTAVSYTTSEEMLGIALKGIREQFILATKSMQKTYQGMKNDINQSLERLKTDYIDLYQCHFVRSMTDYQQIIGQDGAYQALLEAQQAGKIRHIGITSHSADLLKQIISEKKFATIQFPYNFLELQGEELFISAKQLDIGVIIMKPLAGGIINNYSASLKFILQNPNVCVAIPGMASIDEVQKNVLVPKNLVLDASELLYINETRAKLANDFCHRCGYCLPCVKGIDIPSLFTFELYWRVYKLESWAKARYNNALVKADSCLKCGLCEQKCPYHLPIRMRLERIAKMFR